MIPAIRIVRRLVRKLTKPLRLHMTTAAIARSEAQVETLLAIREEAAQLIVAEHRYQVHLAVKRNRIEAS